MRKRSYCNHLSLFPSFIADHGFSSGRLVPRPPLSNFVDEVVVEWVRMAQYIGWSGIVNVKEGYLGLDVMLLYVTAEI